jgi:predicted DCC family thiol-disulfide oxidoreductase YuxK
MEDQVNMDPQIEAQIKSHGLILYDGDCGFCQFWVQFILERDSNEHFVFAPLQAKWAGNIHNKNVNQEFDTLLLYENQMLFEKSTAVLKIAKKLKWPWKGLWVFYVVPKPIRDFIYDFIAKRRQNIGLKADCKLLTKEEKARFLD